MPPGDWSRRLCESRQDKSLQAQMLVSTALLMFAMCWWKVWTLLLPDYMCPGSQEKSFLSEELEVLWGQRAQLQG